MKKIREMLPLNDRMKLIVSASAVGLLLIAAMLIPLAFRTSPSAESAADGVSAEESRANLFAEYWNSGGEAEGITVEKPDSVSEVRKAASEKVFRELADRCINDRALSEPEPTGREYTVLRRDDGTVLHLCRMWMEARGDWQNWLDVCFDSESGEVFYLYVSRECISNLQQYQSGSAVSTPEDVAKLLAEEYGWTLRYTGTGGSDVTAAVYTAEDGGTLCYEVGCRVYDALVDVKLCCK